MNRRDIIGAGLLAGSTPLVERLRSLGGDFVSQADAGEAGKWEDLDALVAQWAAQPNGGEIRLDPKKTYYIEKPILIPERKDAQLVFDGCGAKIYSSHDGVAIENKNQYTVFRNFGIFGPGSNRKQSVGIRTSLYAGSIDNVRIDNFFVGIKLSTITGSIRRLHAGGNSKCIWIEDFSNILTIEDCYFTSSEDGIYVPNTSGNSANYVAQLVLISCAFEVMKRSLFAPSTINRLSAFNCWTERETEGSFVLTDTPAYIFNTNFVTHLPQIRFSKWFPEESKQYHIVDCYHGSRSVYLSSAAVDAQQFESQVGPDSPEMWIAGKHRDGGIEKTVKIGFGRGRLLVSAPSLSPVNSDATLGDRARPFREVHLANGAYVDGEKIIGPRLPAISDPEPGEERQAIIAILSILRKHGLIDV